MSEPQTDFAGEQGSADYDAALRLVEQGRESEVAESLLSALMSPAIWRRSRALNRVIDFPPADRLVPPLASALADDFRPERRNAARAALAKLASPDSPHSDIAVAHLVGMLEHARSADERLLAATALGESQNVRGRLALESSLNDPDPNVGSAGAEALGQLSDRRAVPALINAVQTGPFWLQAAAIVALGQLGDRRALEVLGEVIRTPSLKLPAAVAIGQIGDPSDVELLRPAIEGGGEGARAALQSIARIHANASGGHPPRWLREATQAWDDELIVQLREDRKVEAARLLGISASEEAVTELLKLLNDPDLVELGAIGLEGLPAETRTRIASLQDDSLSPGGRAVVLDLVPTIRNSEELELLGRNLGDANELVRAATASLLGRSDPDIALPYLEKLISDPEMRMGAVQAYSQFGRLRCDPLVSLLKDDDPQIRAVAARSLGKCISEDVSPLVNALATESESSVRHALLAALGDSGAAASVAALKVALGDSDEAIRFSAVRALGRTGVSEALDPLLAALKDSSHDVRIATLIALGDLGDPRGSTTLSDYLAGESADVRRTAARSIDKLGGQSLLVQIAEALNDPDEGVRFTAVETLRKLGDPEVVELLNTRLEIEPSASIREAASRAIVELRPEGDEPS